MKRRAREHAENTVGKDVLAAAETYEQILIHGSNAPGVDIPPSPANSAKEGVLGPRETQADDDESQHCEPHSPGINEDDWGQDVNKVIDATGFAYGLNTGFYAGRREMEEKNWRSRFPAMFPVFLSCQQRSGNWSNCAHDIDWKEECHCVGSYRTLDVLDLICEFFSLLTLDLS
jgi:hypothetical protein